MEALEKRCAELEEEIAQERQERARETTHRILSEGVCVCVCVCVFVCV